MDGMSRVKIEVTGMANWNHIAPEGRRGLDSGIWLPEERSELESLGITEPPDGVDASHGNGHCADTSKSAELVCENFVGSMVLVPHVTTHTLSIQALKERIKDQLKKKLKPKLRLGFFKLRQEKSSTQVPIPWVSTTEVASPNQQNRYSSSVANMNQPFSRSDVTPLKMRPAGVKTEPEEGVFDVPRPSLSLTKEEPKGSLVVANGSKGRRKAGNRMSQLSRVNRFADSILQFVGERSVPEKLIRSALGNNPDISKAIRLLLSEKRLKRLGDGGKGCAYVYVRIDPAEAEPKKLELDPMEISAQALTIEREFVRELERRFPATDILDSTVRKALKGSGRMQGDRVQFDV